MTSFTNSPVETTGELIVLGSGTSHGVPLLGCRCPVCRSTNPLNTRTRSSILIQAPTGNFLVDTTPEMRIQLLREKIELVHAVLYTHSHADHIFGMDDLRQFGHLLDRDIPLYCEPLVESQLRAAFSYAFQPPELITRRGAVPRLDIRSIGLDPFDLHGIRIQPLRLMHGKLPILGYRIGNIAYCTDVSEIPAETWPLMEGLDVLIIDALRFRAHPTHFNLRQAVEVSERLRPRKTYFTHIAHDLDHDLVDSRLPAGMRLAYDGLRIPLRFPVWTT
ncbi:MAG: MBL fold metallo-hydrolase [Planctomycetaceae bacterium]|nr:MBL fold metallo-hydrolase [Planctomycetaceae bacterium]